MINVASGTTVIFAQIQKLIDENPTVLFMKGTKQFPMCGFSGFAVQALTQCNIEFVDINVLEDPEMREGIKEFTNWPTIPQLYVRGEFIGGADIIKEMLQSGELQALFQAA